MRRFVYIMILVLCSSLVFAITNTFELAVYRNNTEYIADSGPQEVDDLESNHWITYDVETPLPDDGFYLAAWSVDEPTSGDSELLFYDSGSAEGFTDAETYDSDWPGTLSVSSNTNEYSIYGNFTNTTQAYILDDSCILEDTYTESDDSADDLGDFGSIRIINDTGDELRSFTMWNDSCIPSEKIVVSAKTCHYVFLNGFDNTNEIMNVTAHLVYPYPTFNISDVTWCEGDGTSGNEDCELVDDTKPLDDGTEYNLSRLDSVEVQGTGSGNKGTPSAGTVVCWNTTDGFKIAHNINADNNITIMFKGVDVDGHEPSGTFDYFGLYSKEWGTADQRPFTIVEVDDVPAEGDTCDYSSGDFEIDCTEECTIDSDVDVAGNEWLASGSGTIQINARVHNFSYRKVSGGCHVVLNQGNGGMIG